VNLKLIQCLSCQLNNTMTSIVNNGCGGGDSPNTFVSTWLQSRGTVCNSFGLLVLH
jgi:hypothetical protein